MTSTSIVREIYGVADTRSQTSIVGKLRRKRNVTAKAAEHDHNAVVVVSCPPSRAQWVFRKVMSIDPRAVLLFATTRRSPAR
jgi:hypothetical protein